MRRPTLNRSVFRNQLLGIDIDSPQATSYVLEDLSDGEWRLGVSAVTERDLESKLITATVVIKDEEATWDDDTLGKVFTRQDAEFAASRNKRAAKP